MNPYGVAQSYAEAPSKDWVLVEPASYAEPRPYAASEVLPDSDGNAEDALTFSETATGGVIGILTHITYGVEVPYVEPYPYAGLPLVEVTHKAENELTFSETAYPGREQASDLLAFSQEAERILDASNTLTFSYGFDSQASDELTFTQAAIYELAASNELTFTETVEQLNAQLDQALTFEQAALYDRDQSDVLAFVQEVSIIKASSDVLAFNETAAVIHAASDVLSFSDPVIATIPSNHLLAFVQEVTSEVAQGSSSLLQFTETASWNRTKQGNKEHQLRFIELVTYSTAIASGGSGFNPVPEVVKGLPHITVGTHTFRMASEFTADTMFTNGKYLNIGTKYSLPLSRPLEVVGDWQLVLKALIGTQQVVTNLFAAPFNVFITDESTLTSEGMDLVFYALDYDTRGQI